MSNTQYDDELFDEIDEFDDYEELGGGAGFGEEHERDTVRSTGFRIAAVVMFLISIGGLFLGLISKWVSFLTPVASTGTDGALNNSLMGILIEVFKGLFSDSGMQPVKVFSFKKGLPVLLSAVQYYFYFVFLACLILSLMLTIISLTPERIHEGKERASRAERCAYGIALLNVFGFGGIFLIQMFAASSLVHYFKPMVVDTIDFSSLIIAIVSVVFLLLIALSGAKKREETMGNIVTGFLLHLLSFIAVFAIAHPGSRVVSDLDYAFTADSGISLGIRIFAIVLTVIAILNLAITLFRMRAKRGYIFDTARFGLQLIVAVVVIALYIAIPEAGTAPDFGVLATLPALLLLLVSLAAFLLALLAMILAIKRGSASSSENKARIIQQPVQPPMVMNPLPVAPMMAPQEEEDQTTNVSIVLDRPSKPQDEEDEEENVDEPAEEEKKDEPFTVSETLLPETSKPESEKVVKSIVYVTNITGNNGGEPAFDEKNDLPYDINETPIAYSDESLFDAPKKSAPVIVEIPEPKPMKEPEPYRNNEDDYEPARDLPKTERIREIYYYKDDKEEKNEEPIEKKPEKQKEPEVKEEKPEEKKPEPVKTEFMKEMEALARDASKSAKQEEPQKSAYENRYTPPPAPAPATPAAPAYQPPQPPVPPYGGYYGRQPQPTPSAAYIDAQYTYDPFFITLTPQERNEFGDLFISNKFGVHAYLPLYVIGGENKEFFEKIFIYLGKYRGNISTELLDKIYTYISAKH